MGLERVLVYFQDYSRFRMRKDFSIGLNYLKKEFLSMICGEKSEKGEKGIEHGAWRKKTEIRGQSSGEKLKALGRLEYWNDGMLW